MDSDSYSDGEIDVKAEYRKLYDSWVELSKENLNLLKNKTLLEAQINITEMEKSTTLMLETSTCVTKDKGLHKQTEDKQENSSVLESKINRLSDLLSEEKEKSRSLEHNFNENHKKIRMLSKGTKDLDTLLAMGHHAKQNWGLGYKEYRVLSSTNSVSNQTGLINFFVLNQFVIINQRRLNHIKPVQAGKYLLNRKIRRQTWLLLLWET